MRWGSRFHRTCWPPDLLGNWTEWFAPSVQPLPIPEGMDSGELRPDQRPLPDEPRDTYRLPSDRDDVTCTWPG